MTQAFIHAQIGGVIEDREMPGLDGSKHHLLSNAAVNVFLFLKPGQEHSRTTLQQIAVCEKEFASNSVYWVAIFSDRFPKADIEKEVQEAGLAMPVLIDAGDALYGKLGVALCPVAGITDRDHKLVAYQPFTKVNYVEVIRARIRHGLKQINDEELQEVLQPPAAIQGGDAEVARRYLKLGEKQLQAGNYDKALENAGKSIEKDSSSAAGPVLVGRIYRAQENWAEALKAFEQALKLDPTNAAALEGKQACQEKLK